ncbi:hypothetical protein LI169_20450, partial [Desulfovibrio desulfuricans]|nr:hypothetical protein [Desulfovibrio desulfuricans]
HSHNQLIPYCAIAVFRPHIQADEHRKDNPYHGKKIENQWVNRQLVSIFYLIEILGGIYKNTVQQNACQTYCVNPTFLKS